MTTILEFLKGTPWWVYLLFFYLLKIGFSAMKESVVSIIKLAVLPVLFTILMIHTLIASFDLNLKSIGILIFGLFVGTVVGWMLAARHQYKVDKKHWLILMPGNCVTLILILLIFISKYYFGYQLSAHAGIVHNVGFEFLMLSVSGACTGLFIGRFVLYLSCFSKTESVNLK